MSNSYWLIGAVAAIVLVIYWVIPAFKLKANTNKVVKGVIFGSIIVALSVDFLAKEKYAYLMVLALGSMGFYYALWDSKSK